MLKKMYSLEEKKYESEKKKKLNKPTVAWDGVV